MRSLSPVAPVATDKLLLKDDLINNISLKQSKEWSVHLSITPDGNSG
jgi:hypothetical protein